MPILLVIIGALLIITAVRDTTGDLATHLDQDLTQTAGKTGPSFWVWVVAIVFIGIVGYIPGLKTPSRAFLVLVILVIALKSGSGFFSQLKTQLTSPVPQEAEGTPAPANLPNPTVNIQITGGAGSALSSIGSGLSSAANAATGLAGVIKSILPF